MKRSTGVGRFVVISGGRGEKKHRCGEVSLLLSVEEEAKRNTGVEVSLFATSFGVLLLQGSDG